MLPIAPFVERLKNSYFGKVLLRDFANTFFFSIWVFFHEHSRFTGQQGKAEDIYLTPVYHFHPLHGHLDISWVIAADSSPLRIASIASAQRKELLIAPFVDRLKTATLGNLTERFCQYLEQFT